MLVNAYSLAHTDTDSKKDKSKQCHKRQAYEIQRLKDTHHSTADEPQIQDKAYLR